MLYFYLQLNLFWTTMTSPLETRKKKKKKKGIGEYLQNTRTSRKWWNIIFWRLLRSKLAVKPRKTYWSVQLPLLKTPPPMKFSSSQMDKLNVDHKVVIFVNFDHFSGAAPPPSPGFGYDDIFVALGQYSSKPGYLTFDPWSPTTQEPYFVVITPKYVFLKVR